MPCDDVPREVVSRRFVSRPARRAVREAVAVEGQLRVPHGRAVAEAAERVAAQNKGDARAPRVRREAGRVLAELLVRDAVRERRLCAVGVDDERRREHAAREQGEHAASHRRTDRAPRRGDLREEAALALAPTDCAS